MVTKKDGSLQFCVDYWRLNAVTQKEVYPLSRVEDIQTSLENVVFHNTELGLRGQIELEEDGQKRNAFTTH